MKENPMSSLTCIQIQPLVFYGGNTKSWNERKENPLTRQIVCERHNAITWQIESIICKVDLN